MMNDDVNFTSSSEFYDDEGDNETMATTTESAYFIVPNEDPMLAQCTNIVLRSDVRVSDEWRTFQ
jgi:hypothetical protein